MQPGRQGCTPERAILTVKRTVHWKRCNPPPSSNKKIGGRFRPSGAPNKGPDQRVLQG